mgnify:CR=1 FL=1
MQEQRSPQRKQAKVGAQSAQKPKWMALIDGGNEKHAGSMREPADQNGYCKASNERAWRSGVEVKEAGDKQWDVLRGVAMSSNCLGQRGVRYGGIAAALKPHS